MMRLPQWRNYALALASLSACSAYQPQPLPEVVERPQTAATFTVNAADLPFTNLQQHRFDPSDGLDYDEVAILAVVNNPQLRAARDGLAVSQAQVFAAGLLPDPQIGLSLEHPTNGSAGNSTGFGLGLNQDVSALLLRSTRQHVARLEQQRVHLDLLWQEWQVLTQARLLFARLKSEESLLALLREEQSMLADRAQSSLGALAEGHVTRDVADADQIAWQNTGRQLRELQRTQLKDQAELASVLGLAVTARLDLVGEPAPLAQEPAQITALASARVRQRPDMRALAMAYRSQEAGLHQAVLEQFPALNLGISRARDTSGLESLGFGLSLSLPVLNRNRGNIAIEQATRQRLYDEYGNRLAEAQGEVAIAIANLTLLREQLRTSQDGVADLKLSALRAEQASRSGELRGADYVRINSAWLDKRSEIINLKEAVVEQEIALEALLGPDLSADVTQKGQHD